MNREHNKSGPAKRLPLRRKRIDRSQESWVSTAPLYAEKALPIVVRPAVDGVALVAWAAQHKNEINDLVFDHGAVLFRGFNLSELETFQRFVEATSDGPALDYTDRTTPRESRGKSIYTSTVYPANQTIKLHNEGTYWLTWALKLFFYSRTAATSGGETPIADVRKVYQRLDPELRDRFASKGMMLVRNYNDGFGLPWQEVFQTQDRSEVEKYCRANRIEFEWKGGDRLRTRQARPAIHKHPRSGEMLWFNHAAFFHVSSLDHDLQQALLADCGEADLPYNTYYGDGTAIAPEDIEQIHAAYRAETIMFPWQDGDVMILDNMAVAHARQPYEGEREVVVMMTEAYTGTGVTGPMPSQTSPS